MRYTNWWSLPLPLTLNPLWPANVVQSVSVKGSFSIKYFYSTSGLRSDLMRWHVSDQVWDVEAKMRDLRWRLKVARLSDVQQKRIPIVRQRYTKSWRDKRRSSTGNWQLVYCIALDGVCVYTVWLYPSPSLTFFFNFIFQWLIIFKLNLASIIGIQIYGKLQSFIRLFLNLMKLCHFLYGHPENFPFPQRIYHKT